MSKSVTSKHIGPFDPQAIFERIQRLSSDQTLFFDEGDSMEGPKSEPPETGISTFIAALEEAQRKAEQAMTEAGAKTIPFSFEPLTFEKGGTDLEAALAQIRLTMQDMSWPDLRIDPTAFDEPIDWDAEFARTREKHDAMPPNNFEFKEIFKILPVENHLNHDIRDHIIPLSEPNQKLDPPFILDHDTSRFDDLGTAEAPIDDDPYSLRELLARERAYPPEPLYDEPYLSDRLDGVPRLEATVDYITRLLNKDHRGKGINAFDDDGPDRLDF